MGGIIFASPYCILMEMYIPIRCPPYILSYCDTGMTSMIGDGGLDPEDAEVVVLP